jgi:hypothetical protein
LSTTFLFFLSPKREFLLIFNHKGFTLPEIRDIMAFGTKYTAGEYMYDTVYYSKDSPREHFSSLREKTLFIFDQDGTLYLGSRPFDFAVRFISRLRDAGKRVLFFTNKRQPQSLLLRRETQPSRFFAAERRAYDLRRRYDTVPAAAQTRQNRLSRRNPAA